MKMLLETALKLKILSVLVGLVNVLLTTQYYQPESVFEVFFLAAVAVTFVISVMYLVAINYLGKAYTLTVRKCDAAIHFVMGLILFFVSIAFLLVIQVTTRRLCAPPGTPQDEEDCFTRQAFRIILGVMCIINSVLYGVICYLLLSSERHAYEQI